ncbi:MAG: hypothetical protein JNK27_11720 [Chitinophagaceae bacterium]|nr:hypothetical protein [Chitinophagaceae bacterium]
MKQIKIIDLVIQLLITVGGLIWLFAGSNNNSLFYIYFFLGGWQLLSFLAHLLVKENWLHHVERKRYFLTLLWTAGLGLVSYLLLLAEVPFILFYLAALLFVSPFYAIWYFIIGFRELSAIKNRELIHLK